MFVLCPTFAKRPPMRRWPVLKIRWCMKLIVPVPLGGTHTCAPAFWTGEERRTNAQNDRTSAGTDSRCSRLTRLREGSVRRSCLRSSSTCERGPHQRQKRPSFRRGSKNDLVLHFGLLHLAVCRVQCNR